MRRYELGSIEGDYSGESFRAAGVPANTRLVLWWDSERQEIVAQGQFPASVDLDLIDSEPQVISDGEAVRDLETARRIVRLFYAGSPVWDFRE